MNAYYLGAQNSIRHRLGLPKRVKFLDDNGYDVNNDNNS